MLTISVWPRRLKEFLLTHPLYKSPDSFGSLRVSRGKMQEWDRLDTADSGSGMAE